MSLFTEQDRQIYTDPATGRKYDPLAVKRAITAATNGQFNVLVTAVSGDDPARAADAQDRLIAAARSAFGLKPLDPDTGQGVLDAVAYEALIEFTRWLKGKGPRAQTRPNSAPCTDSPAPSTTTRSSP
jgi:hypothetical protein